MKKNFGGKRVVWFVSEVATQSTEREATKPDEASAESALTAQELRLAEQTKQRLEKNGKSGEAGKAFSENYQAYKNLDAQETGVAKKRDALVRFLREALQSNGTDADLQKAYESEAQKILAKTKEEKSHLNFLENPEEFNAFKDYLLHGGMNVALAWDRQFSEWRANESRFHAVNLSDPDYAAKWNASVNMSARITAAVQNVYALRDGKNDNPENWYEAYKNLQTAVGKNRAGEDLIRYEKFEMAPIVTETPKASPPVQPKAVPTQEVGPAPQTPEPPPQPQEPAIVAKRLEETAKPQPTVVKMAEIETALSPERAKTVPVKAVERAKEEAPDGTPITKKEANELLALYERISGALAAVPSRTAGRSSKKIGEGQQTQFEINTDLAGYNNLRALKTTFGDIADSWIPKIKSVQARMQEGEGLQLISLKERGNEPMAQLLIRKMPEGQYRYYLKELPRNIQTVDEVQIAANK